MDLKKFTDFLQLTTPVVENTIVESKSSNSLNTETEVKPADPAVYVKQAPQTELFSWKYNLPPFKLPKRILRSAFVFVFLFSIFLVLAQEWIFLLMLLGFAFTLNLLLKSKEGNVMNYKIYNNGFDYSGNFYPWEQLSMFFYYEGSLNQLIINTKDPIPGRLYVYYNEKDKEKIEESLITYIPKNLVHEKDFFEYLIFKVKPYINLSDEN